jgi:uncharacterized protein (DUF111 family)
VSVKIAHRGGVVVLAATELGDAAAAAHRLGRPLRDVIETVTAKSVESGIVRGAIVPGSARTTGTR